MICGHLRLVTTADEIAFGRGANCRYCRREISKDMIAKLPDITPTYLIEDEEQNNSGTNNDVYCSIVCRDKKFQEIMGKVELESQTIRAAFDENALRRS